MVREKKSFIDREKLFKFEAEGREFAKIMTNEIIETNSERSEQLLVFCSRRFVISNKLEKLRSESKKPGQITVVIHYCNLSRFF